MGTWRAKGDIQPKGQVVYIADRIIIEKDADGSFKTSVLAQGIFATMQYDKSTGYLCTEKSACIELKRNVLRVGTPTGIKEYEREKN